MNSYEKIWTLFSQLGKVSTDTRNIEDGSIFFALKGANFNGNQFADEALKKGAEYAIIDQKEFLIDQRTILVDDVLESLQKLSTRYRLSLRNTSFIAIGGSNGKTTTKNLLEKTFSQERKTFATRGNLNNHIGVPLTLLSIPKDTEFAFIEFGANHPKEHQLLCAIAKPDQVLITNIGKDHLEGFGGPEGVVKAYKELVDYSDQESKPLFFFKDQSELDTMVKGSFKVSFGQSLCSDFRGKVIKEFPSLVIEVENFEKPFESKLSGSLNLGNMLAVLAIGIKNGISEKTLRRGISEYFPDNNRSQILKRNGLSIILDCYNANPTSMSLALESLKNAPIGNKSVLLGGMKELGKYSDSEHQAIFEELRTMRLDRIILVGKEFFGFDEVPGTYFFSTTKELEKAKEDVIPKTGLMLVKGSRSYALESLFKE